MLKDRCRKILYELTNDPGITSKDLEEKLGLSSRQLGYSIEKVNEWLLEHDYPVIERTRKGHFVIDQSILSQLSNAYQADVVIDSMILTEEQRIPLILMMMMSSDEELSLNHFAIELDVSKNTVLNDIKQAQSYLDQYHLQIKYSRKNGYLIEGQEFQIRKLLSLVTGLILNMPHGEEKLKEITNIREEQISEFTKRLENVENQLRYTFTDERMGTMPYILILILRRIKKGHDIKSFGIEYEELSNTNEYKATEEILYDMDDIPEKERLFITLYLLTANIFSSKVELEEEIPNIVSAIDSMLRQFEQSACIYFQDRNALIEKLLQHIKPAYYRIKYQLTDSILVQGILDEEYKEIKHLVKRSLYPLEQLIGSSIPNNEIEYITMLIGGWMSKQGESIDKKVKAIVVCPQGISVSRLLFNELQQLFPEFVFLDYLSVREFLNYKLEYDIVFSPINLETNKKLFITRAVLGKEEKNRLRKQVMLAIYGICPDEINLDEIIGIIKKHLKIYDEKALRGEIGTYFRQEKDHRFIKHTMETDKITLDQLITPENIVLMDTVQSWKEAIRISSAPLLNSGKIESRYIDEMIRYSETEPYIVIGPNAAIPHAAPEDGANEVGMSMLRLKEGVRYTDNYKIQLVIVISAVDKKQHIHALMQLMNLVSSETDRNKVITADTVDEIYEVIRFYSKDKQRT